MLSQKVIEAFPLTNIVPKQFSQSFATHLALKVLLWAIIRFSNQSSFLFPSCNWRPEILLRRILAAEGLNRLNHSFPRIHISC